MSWPLPTHEPLITVEDKYPATRKAAARGWLVSLWHDLAEARTRGINTGWSINCGNLAYRIVRLTRHVGTIPWGEVSVYLLVDGVYERLHQENGLDYPPIDWDAVRATVARIEQRQQAAFRTAARQ